MSATSTSRLQKKKVVITYGTFDLIHEGHVRLLERAKQYGDYLIVGVTSENYDRQRGKLNVKQSLIERIENVKRTGLADLIIVEEYEGQKIEDIIRYGVDVFVIGSDWKGKFDYLREFCEVVYLERTRGISSSLQRGIVRLGIVGPGRIARRFVPEAKFVSGASVEAVYHVNNQKAKEFAEDLELAWGGDNWGEFVKYVDAVYIATPHHLHVEYAIRALKEGKHVLVEKPLALTKQDAEALFALGNSSGLVVMEALKTAYLPAFRKAIGMALSGAIGEVIYVDATFTKLVPYGGREFDLGKQGGAFTELGSYVLLPMARLLGKSKWGAEVRFATWKQPRGVDLWTAVEVWGSKMVGYGKVGLRAKAEGSLVISGTEGYIYVPAPWWKTAYFEIRRENTSENRLVADAFEGEGLRYEIAEFITAIQHKRKSTALDEEDSIWMASVMEVFLKGLNTKEVRS
jgi:choline-phosphate cytidylyltransferase